MFLVDVDESEQSNLIAPSLLEVPKGPEGSWCYAKSKFMF